MTNKSKIPRKISFALLIFFGIFFWPAGKATAQGLIATMTEQLAKWEVYLQEVKKGYAIVQQGLTTIGDIKKGDLDLHTLFFNSLKQVNPAIKNWGKVADILAMQGQILLGCATTFQQFSVSGSFSAEDLKYLSAVYSNLKDLTSKDIDELNGLVTDGNWQMSDDERMGRIDQLFTQVTEKYTFIRSFANRVSLEGQERTQEKASLQKLGKLFQP
jgi:hypothetical protein